MEEFYGRKKKSYRSSVFFTVHWNFWLKGMAGFFFCIEDFWLVVEFGCVNASLASVISTFRKEKISWRKGFRFKWRSGFEIAQGWLITLSCLKVSGSMFLVCLCL